MFAPSDGLLVFYDKKWSCDHLGGFDVEFIWLFGNIIFYGDSCSPS